MRKIVLMLLVLLVAFPVVSEVQMPIQDMAIGLHVMQISDSYYEGQAYGFNGFAYVSVIDWFLESLSLLEGVRERVRFGDYVGGHIILDAASYSDELTHLEGVLIGFGLAYGGQAAVSITSDIDAGFRFFKDARGYLFGDTDADIGGESLNISLMGRYKKLFVEAGTEFDGVTGFSAGVRYLLSSSMYLGLRYESKQLIWASSGEDAAKLNSIGIQFGIY